MGGDGIRAGLIVLWTFVSFLVALNPRAFFRRLSRGTIQLPERFRIWFALGGAVSAVWSVYLLFRR
jgi:hypothetical protein